VTAGKLRISDSQISNCRFGAWGYRNLLLERTTISGCQEAMKVTTVAVLKGTVTLIDSLISGNDQVIGENEGRATILNSEVSGNTSGIQVYSARLENSVVADNGDYGVRARRSIDVEGGEVTGNGLVALTGEGGLFGRRVSVRNATIDGNYGGMTGLFTGKVRDSIVSNNLGNGVTGAKLTLIGATVTGNQGHGVLSRTNSAPDFPRSYAKGRLSIRDSVILGNALFGAVATGPDATTQDCSDPGTVVVKATDLTGNGLDSSCGTTEACGSVGSCAAPKLLEVTCDTSYVVGSGIPGQSWSLCAQD
jgi:hypothetical protein